MVGLEVSPLHQSVVPSSMEKELEYEASLREKNFYRFFAV
jgi:hypothetical protein